MSSLTDWENFYVIVGSSAGALTGLMFVVITLVADQRRRGASGDVAAYATPNVVHFCAVLLISALLSAPWQSRALPAILLILTGLGGVAYAAIIFRRMVRRARLHDGYNPVAEDWLWFAILPLAAYLALVVAAILLFGDPTVALFITGAVAVMLLFTGIRNAWDSVTYIAVERPQKPNVDKDKSAL